MSLSTLEQWREKAKQLQTELMKVKQDYNQFREVQEDIERDQAAQIDEKARELKKVCTENSQLKTEFDKIKERSKKFQLQYQQSQKDKQMLSQSIRRNDDELNDYKGQIVKLQIDNDDLRNQLRNERGRNTHLEQTLDTMLQQNGLLKTELQDTKNQAKQQIQRLKQQLDEASMEVQMKERQIKKIRLPGQDALSPSQASTNNNNNNGQNMRNQTNLAIPTTDIQMRSPHRRATVYTYSRYSARSSLNSDYFTTKNPNSQLPHQSTLQNQQLQTSFSHADQIQNTSGVSRNGRKSLSGEQQSSDCVIAAGLQTPVHMPILEGDAKDEASPQKNSDRNSSCNSQEKQTAMISNQERRKIKLNEIQPTNNNNNQADLQADDDHNDSDNSFQDDNIFQHNRDIRGSGDTFVQNANASLRPRRMTGKKLSDLFDMESDRINMDKLLEMDLQQAVMPSQYALNVVNDIVSEMDSHLLSLNQKKGDIAHYRYQDEMRFPGESLAVMG